MRQLRLRNLGTVRLALAQCTAGRAFTRFPRSPIGDRLRALRVRVAWDSRARSARSVSDLRRRLQRFRPADLAVRMVVVSNILLSGLQVMAMMPAFLPLWYQAATPGRILAKEARYSMDYGMV